MAKKTTESAVAHGVSLSFTTEEISWLAWVMRDVISTLVIDAVGEEARNKLFEADDLLNQIAEITGTKRKIYEKVKTGEIGRAHV